MEEYHNRMGAAAADFRRDLEGLVCDHLGGCYSDPRRRPPPRPDPSRRAAGEGSGPGTGQTTRRRSRRCWAADAAGRRLLLSPVPSGKNRSHASLQRKEGQVPSQILQALHRQQIFKIRERQPEQMVKEITGGRQLREVLHLFFRKQRSVSGGDAALRWHVVKEERLEVEEQRRNGTENEQRHRYCSKTAEQSRRNGARAGGAEQEQQL